MSVKDKLQVKVLLYFMAKGLEEISNTDEDFQEDFEDFEAVIQWNVGDDIHMYLIIQEGKVKGFLDAVADDPTVNFSVEELDKAKEILSGQVDGTSAYMSGDLKMEGDMQAGMKMGQVAEYLQEALGDLMS